MFRVPTREAGKQRTVEYALEKRHFLRISVRCRATNRDGVPCQKYAAAWHLTCTAHGAKSPKAIEAAWRRRVAAYERWHSYSDDERGNHLPLFPTGANNGGIPTERVRRKNNPGLEHKAMQRRRGEALTQLHRAAAEAELEDHSWPPRGTHEQLWGKPRTVAGHRIVGRFQG